MSNVERVLDVKLSPAEVEQVALRNAARAVRSAVGVLALSGVIHGGSLVADELKDAAAHLREAGELVAAKAAEDEHLLMLARRQMLTERPAVRAFPVAGERANLVIGVPGGDVSQGDV